MTQLNREAIKKEARNFIETDRKWLTMGLACLPIELIVAALGSGNQFMQRFYQDDGTYFSISFGGGFLSWLLIPFTIAIAGYFLNHLRGGKSWNYCRYKQRFRKDRKQERILALYYYCFWLCVYFSVYRQYSLRCNNAPRNSRLGTWYGCALQH